LLDIEQLHKSVVLVRGDYRLFDALVTALAEHARSPVRDEDGITGERHLLRLLNASDDTLLDARYELLTTLAVAHELIAVRVLLLEHRNLREQAQMLLHDVCCGLSSNMNEWLFCRSYKSAFKRVTLPTLM
jgi:hypothetical protein